MTAVAMNPMRESETMFEIVNAIIKPASNIKTFKQNVLECLHTLFPEVGFTFYSYNEMANSAYRYRLTDMMIENLPSWFCDERWMKDYSDSCIYNPNYHAKLLDPEKSVFTISDIVSFRQYEESANYRDIVRPSGNYYSMVTFLRDNGELLGQIGLLRPKSAGDFTSGEISLFEKISMFVSNRMKEFICRREHEIYKQLFHSMMEKEPNGVVLLDNKFRVIDQNSLFANICSEMFEGVMNPPVAVKFFLTKLAGSMECGQKDEIEFSTLKGYMITINEQKIPFGNEMESVYIVNVGQKTDLERPQEQKESVEFEALTLRQKEIVRLIAKGYSNKAIAEELVISERTVKKHVENIRMLLGVNSKIAILKKTRMIH